MQSYSLALVCLLLGLALGYLLRGWAPGAAGAANVATPVAAASLMSGQVPGMTGVPGSTAVRPEEIDKAAQPLLQALKRDPSDAGALARLGNFYYDAQQYPKAIEYYGQALKIRPQNVDVRTDMATAMWYAGNADAALAQFEKSLSYNPEHAATLFNMGIVRWQGKADAKGAIQLWEKLLKTNPEYAESQRVQQLIAQARENGARGGTGRR
jgi:tetratricopeptide (TPR) repeat protein